jgi:hypothetical protein
VRSALVMSALEKALSVRSPDPEKLLRTERPHVSLARSDRLSHSCDQVFPVFMTNLVQGDDRRCEGSIGQLAQVCGARRSGTSAIGASSSAGHRSAERKRTPRCRNPRTAQGIQSFRRNMAKLSSLGR